MLSCFDKTDHKCEPWHQVEARGHLKRLLPFKPTVEIYSVPPTLFTKQTPQWFVGKQQQFNEKHWENGNAT